MKNTVIMVGGFLSIFLAFTYVPTMVAENHGGKNVLADEMIVEVNESAPVVATGETEISADPEIVWDVMTEIDQWPKWNPDVKDADIVGTVSEGTKFHWKAGPGKITSVIQKIDRHKFLAWTGKTLGIRAIHVWSLEPHGMNTVVTTEESWEGLLTRLFPRRMQIMLKTSIDDGLSHLKKEAERRKNS
jgi:hypothetical protein